ncbi:histidine triad (HIT) family protein [Litorimonas taeanensis]|uniref:Histidine triad (HIT) family protein n=1 Tax=Litorimonas taeanensis TaxID=568099 RepID=A0A420WFK9_9PROT|nr:HIT family protein [Litorimonas taeanensis]RKQ69794.1 histidine triad (HIT) family protein [Litorimonas taeanensis]
MTLHAEYDPSNIFAKIMAHDMPAARVYEDEHILVIMDAFPQSRGHCLVIPKRPVRNLLALAPKDVGRLFGTVQRVAQAVDKALSPDGIVVTQFNGAPAGQSVFHLHVHVIPKFDSENFAGHGEAKMGDIDELKALAQKIAEKL